MLFRRTIIGVILLVLMTVIVVGLLKSNRSSRVSVQFVMSWGVLGREAGEFNQPFDIAVDQKGFVYVTDSGNRRVQKFSHEGTFIRQWGEGQFEKPAGIAVAPDGSIYVTDYFLDRIFHFSPEGRLLTQWGGEGAGPGEFDSPADIAVGEAGHVYVIDEYNHRVQKFTADGHFVLAWGKKGKVHSVLSAINFLLPEGREGEFYYPSRIAVGPEGLVYVSDSYNNRVQVFTPEGQYTRKWGGMGIWGGRFRVASAIAFDPAGHIHAADFYNNRIQVFQREGDYLAQWGSMGNLKQQIHGPTGLAVDAQGDIYVADFRHDRIVKFYQILRLDRNG